MSRKAHPFDKAYSFPPREGNPSRTTTPTMTPGADSDSNRLSPTSREAPPFPSMSQQQLHQPPSPTQAPLFTRSPPPKTPQLQKRKPPPPSFMVENTISPRQKVDQQSSLQQQQQPVSPASRQAPPRPPRPDSLPRDYDPRSDNEDADLGTLNFQRRPSAYPRDSPQPGADEESSRTGRHGRSHSRQDSISLPSPKMPPPTASAWARQSGPTAPARTPAENLASYDMLQGARMHEERQKAASSPFEMRMAPNANDIYRGDPLSSKHHYGAAYETDISTIANQLREHDKRQSEDTRFGQDWRDRFMSTVSVEGPESDSKPSYALNRDFLFPSRQGAAGQHSPGPISTWEEGTEEDDKSVFTDPFTSTEKLNSPTMSWRNEPLGYSGAEKAFTMQRPSIVALPVYPAPNGSYGQSFKYKLKKFTAKLAWVSLILWQIATWYYISRRVEGMVRVENKLPKKFITGWCFLATEILVNFFLAVYSIYAIVIYRTPSAAPKLRLRGDANLPAVDVFVVSSGQPDQYTFDSAIAAASMDYPTHRFRVMVLDPTGSTRLQQDINKHAKSQACPHLSYHKRSLLGPDSTKAMTVNFGIREAATASIKGPADYIVVFDADVIPERNYLRAALPAMLSDTRVGLVKTGNGFINLPLRLDQATATLMDASEPVNNSKSGFVLRRSALADINGFPADSWIADGLVEARLAGAGYTTATVEEVLQWSMAKPTYVDQVHALMVNTVSPLRTAYRMGFFLRGPLNAKMPKMAKARFLGRAFAPFLSIIYTLLTIMFPFMFTYGGIMVLTPDLWHLNLLLQSTLIAVLTGILHGYIWSWATGLPSPRRKLQGWVFAGPYVVIGLLRLFLPRALWGYSRGCENDTTSSTPRRPGALKRFGLLLIDPHSGVIFSYLASIGVCIWRATRDYELGTVNRNQTALIILLTIGWPSLVWLDFLLGTIIPYKCLMFPSRLLTEPRESFLIRDHYSSVARPKHAFKTASPFRVRRFPEFVFNAVHLGWSVTCVVLGVATSLFE